MAYLFEAYGSLGQTYASSISLGTRQQAATKFHLKEVYLHWTAYASSMHSLDEMFVGILDFENNGRCVHVSMDRNTYEINHLQAFALQPNLKTS